MATRGRPPHPEVLTPREQQVLDLLRQGLTNPQIADRLGITLDGAKYHVSEILGKLGVSSREEAAEWTPSRRPWWAAAFAPIGRLADTFAVKIAASAVVATGLAGLGVLIWGVLASDARSKTFDLFPGVYVLDVKSGGYTRLIDNRTAMEYYQDARGVAWSPDGKWLATRGGSGGVMLLDPVSGDTKQAPAAPRNPIRSDGNPEWLVDGRLSTGGRILDPASLSVTWAAPEDLRYASDLSWSPDGTRLVYTWTLVPREQQLIGRPPDAPPLDPPPWRERTTGLYLVDRAGHERLVGAGVFRQPAWSPDSRMLALVADKMEGLPEREAPAIVIFTTDGAVAPVVLPYSTGFAWSPDSGMLALVLREDDIVIANADGSPGLDHVTTGRRPAWSPDGKKLTFVRDGELWEVDLGSNKERRLVQTPLPLISEAAPSPDGRLIAFRVEAKASAVHTINVDGSDERYLIPGDLPQWSPDGSRIGFLLGGGPEGGGGYIYAMSPDLTGFVRLGFMWYTDVAPGPCGGWMAFAWSPDGTRIAYSTYADGGYEVWVSDLDGQSQLVGKGSHPSWSADGQRLAINSRAQPPPVSAGPGCRSDVFELASGSRAVAIDGASAPAWSPDARYIAASDTRSGPPVEIFPGRLTSSTERRLVVKALDTGQTIDLGPGYLGVWSPDSRWLAYLQDGKVLVRRADASGDVRTISDRGGWDVRWSPDGKWLVYTIQEETARGRLPFAIYVAAADGSTPPRRLTSGWHAAWSPDGKRIAFSR